jgi:hypothetical protein
MKPSFKDDPMEEIRQFREEYAAKFDYDLEKIYHDLKRLEQEDDGPYVTLKDGKLVPVLPQRRSSRS